MTKENIMNIIGQIVFVMLCTKYRNEPDNYLAVILFSRKQGWDKDIGLPPHEYGLIFTSKEQEKQFENQLKIPQHFTASESKK